MQYIGVGNRNLKLGTDHIASKEDNFLLQLYRCFVYINYRQFCLAHMPSTNYVFLSMPIFLKLFFKSGRPPFDNKWFVPPFIISYVYI